MGTPSRMTLPSALALALALSATAAGADGPAPDDAVEDPNAAAPPPAPPVAAPAVRAVGFVDRAPDCDPVQAWYGRCVERVDLLDLSEAWREGADPSSETRATWRNIGELFARLWEDVAMRWGVDEDVLQSTLAEAGVIHLPDSTALWESTARGQRRSYSQFERNRSRLKTVDRRTVQASPF